MMGLFRSTPQPGDVVRANTDIPVTIADHLVGGGIPAGSRGVVLDVSSWSRVTVKFDLGHGFTTSTVSSRYLTVQRRRVGEATFSRRAELTHLVRIAFVIAMLAPFVLYVVQYVWVMRTTDGLIEQMAIGVINSMFGLIPMFMQHPVQTLIYLGAGYGAWRFAFPRPRATRKDQ